jgi:hypothetical protein
MSKHGPAKKASIFVGTLRPKKSSREKIIEFEKKILKRQYYN